MTGDVFRRKDWCPTTAAFCPDPGTGHCLRVRWGGGTRERGPPWVPRLLSAVGTDHWCAAVAEDRHEVWICAASSASWDADGVPKPMQDTMSRVVPCRRGARQLRRRSSTARRTDSSSPSAGDAEYPSDSLPGHPGVVSCCRGACLRLLVRQETLSCPSASRGWRSVACVRPCPLEVGGPRAVGRRSQDPVQIPVEQGNIRSGLKLEATDILAAYSSPHMTS
jgi:hypothetical protein